METLSFLSFSDDEVEKEIGSSSSLLDPPEQTETVRGVQHMCMQCM